MEEEGHQQQYYGMLDLSVAPGELAVLAEELAKTSSKVSPGFALPSVSESSQQSLASKLQPNTCSYIYSIFFGYSCFSACEYSSVLALAAGGSAQL